MEDVNPFCLIETFQITTVYKGSYDGQVDVRRRPDTDVALPYDVWLMIPGQNLEKNNVMLLRQQRGSIAKQFSFFNGRGLTTAKNHVQFASQHIYKYTLLFRTY